MGQSDEKTIKEQIPGTKRHIVRYEKADTLLRIALDMQGTAEGLSLDDIMHNYSDKPLSRSTAERLRGAIERLFPQMQQANPDELPKRWRLPNGTTPGFATVAAEELADLAAGVALLRRENMNIQASNAERAISKLRSLMKQGTLTRLAPDLEALAEAEGIALRPGPRPNIDPDIVATLRQAILANQKVKINYLYRSTGRIGGDIIHPYGFIYGSRHYLVAWSQGEWACDFRNYSLSNIKSAQRLNESFVRDKEFSLQDYSQRSFGVFQEEPFDVVWKFSPKVADDAKEFMFHPSQEFEPQSDGSLIVRFHAGGELEMAWHLFTWGEEVEVIEPLSLRKFMMKNQKKK